MLLRETIRITKNVLRPLVRGSGAQAWLDKFRGIVSGHLEPGEFASLVGPSPTILEIGCNNGSDTLEMLKAMPDARIYCFEPDQRAIRGFKQKLSGCKQVTLWEGAISDRNGEIEFHVSSSAEEIFAGGWDQSGSIRRPKNTLVESPWVTFGETIKVPTCRLDDWRAANGIDKVDFIWMDAQGAEGDVIAGGQETLKRTRYLYTEYSNNETYEGQINLRELLKRLPTFEVVARFPGDVLLMNRVKA